mgnify:CR=1 FL=1
MIFKDITDINFHGVNVPSHHEFNHEKVYYYEDELVGLKSLIAIHSSAKGPAIECTTNGISLVQSDVNIETRSAP